MRVELTPRPPPPRGLTARVSLVPCSLNARVPDGWWTAVDLKGHPAEVVVCPAPARSPHALLIALGVGGPHDRCPMAARKANQTLARLARSQHLADLVIDAETPAAMRDPAWLEAFVAGLHAGSYVFADFRQHAAPDSLRRVTILHARPARAEVEAVRTGDLIGRSLRAVRDLANQPGNAAPPRVIADFARRLARQAGLQCQVWDAARLRRERCEAMLAVARGSHEEPRMILLRHRGNGRPRPPLVLVGKTITFDTGGISLKPAKSMEWMRYDKSGGMAVLAAMNLIARARLPCPVIGILAAAENMPGGGATRPGDIVRSRAGPSIEIINTDAEGRLVLADALSVALDFKPAAVVDAATLTGAAVTALGHVLSAVMGNREELVDELQEAGEASGDRVWPLPLYPEYLEMLRSPFADLRNTGDGTAGAIAGGLFLRQFVPDSTPWAHLDLTNAWEERDLPHAAAGANLFGATLLFSWIRRLAGRKEVAWKR